MKKLLNYIRLSYIELKKVIWPDRKTVINHTIMVIAMSLAVAVFLGIIDFIFTTLLNFII